MRAYSMDLRERVLLDSDAGMKAADVAAKYRGCGETAAARNGRGGASVQPRRCIEPHLTLAALIAAHPDRTR